VIGGGQKSAQNQRYVVLMDKDVRREW
jgi:hypothetical protein